jgi:RNA polymerase sigma-70 factor, ECF subfamily
VTAKIYEDSSALRKTERQRAQILETGHTHPTMADPAATSASQGEDAVHGHSTSISPEPKVPAERQPFRQIFDQHAVTVGRTLRYLGVAEADLMDAAQEVFLVVDRRYAEFEGRASLSTWIHEICVRVAMSSRRRQRRKREEVVAEPPYLEVAADQDARVAEGQDRELLRDLLGSLDEMARQIVVLHEIEGLPMREVAEIVGCPLQTAYSRCKAALEKMRGELATGREGHEDA